MRPPIKNPRALFCPRFLPRVLETSFEVDRSGVLLDLDVAIEDVSSELPVDDKPGVLLF